MRYANIFQSEYSLLFALYLEKFGSDGKALHSLQKIFLQQHRETFCMNFDPKVVVVNSEKPFSQLPFLICITCKAISGNFVVYARNCLTSTFKDILMQMRKGNCEKGYSQAVSRNTRGFVSAATDLVMFQEKREAYVLKFFIVNIPASETVSWIFLYNTHNFQLFSSHLSKQINCSTVQGFFKSLFGL